MNPNGAGRKFVIKCFFFFERSEKMLSPRERLLSQVEDMPKPPVKREMKLGDSILFEGVEWEIYDADSEGLVLKFGKDYRHVKYGDLKN